MRKCSVEDCERKHYGVGLCKMHYQRQPHILKMKVDWQHNNPERRKEILHNYHMSEKHTNTHHKYRSTMKGRHGIMLRGAKDRNLDVSIDIIVHEKILETANYSCYYCHNGVGAGSALDRLDNSKGYHADNVVACCGPCNCFRSNDTTSEEFTEIIKLLKVLRKTDNIWNK